MSNKTPTPIQQAIKYADNRIIYCNQELSKVNNKAIESAYRMERDTLIAMKSNLEQLLSVEMNFANNCWQDGQDSVQCYGGSISHNFSTFYKKYEDDGK